MNAASDQALRFTAWSAIIGGLFAYTSVACALMVLRGDAGMVFDGEAMLALPAQMRDLYRLSMLADILGFYLPVLVMATYLWHVFRAEAGMLGDVAVFGMVTYTVLGVSGAAATLAALQPLAQLHAAGDEATRAAAETAWATVAHVSQRGLWWSEGPLVLFWVLVVGKQLKQAGWGPAMLIPAQIVGWGFGLFFLLGFFPALGQLTNLMLVIVVLIFPAWMLLFGLKLLRQPGDRSE